MAISILAVTVIGTIVFRANLPQNFIVPVDRDSIEMETARLLAGPDGAYIYKFTTTDEYNRLKLYVSEYQSGELVDKNPIELGFDGINSPENGEILIVPDFDNFTIKIVISAGGKILTEIPILAEVAGREYYGRSATEIRENINIRYNEEQALLALIYDNDEMSVPALSDLMSGQTEALAQNDYVYYFSFEFCKE